jgi:hypothetical protein
VAAAVAVSVAGVVGSVDIVVGDSVDRIAAAAAAAVVVVVVVVVDIGVVAAAAAVVEVVAIHWGRV